jgi:hypothetical protein
MLTMDVLLITNGLRRLCRKTRVSPILDQSVTYYGVNAHFQNGIAKQRIWDLKGQAQMMLQISPTCAQSVPLVLSLKAGLISPEFHTKHDDLFETMHRKVGGFWMPKSHWQKLLGFLRKTKQRFEPIRSKGATNGDDTMQPVMTLTGKNQSCKDEPPPDAGGCQEEENEPPGKIMYVSNDELDLHVTPHHNTAVDESPPHGTLEGTTAWSGQNVEVTQ